MRNRAFFIVGMISFALVSGAVLVDIPIPSPGASGMNSQADLDAIKQTDSRYSENVDITTNPGRVINRRGVSPVDTTTTEIGSAMSYFNGTKFWKQIIGIKNSTDSMFVKSTGTYYDGTIDSVEFSDSVYWGFPTDSIGLIRVSDTFAISVGNSTPNDYGTRKRSVVYNDERYHDFTKYKDFIIHADGSGLPVVYASQHYNDTVNPDTMKYQPRTVELTIPRPGEPRVRLIGCDCNTTLSGTYEYTYVIVVHELGMDFPYTSDTAFHSIQISPYNECVFIDGFMTRSFTRFDSTRWEIDKRGSQILLFRRNVENYSGHVTDSGSVGYATNWKLIENFWVGRGEHKTIIDSGQVRGDTTLVSCYRTQRSAFYGGVPGGPRRSKYSTASATDSLTIHFEYPESLVVTAWAWYDPVTEIESPLSQITERQKILYDTTSATVFSIPYITKNNGFADFYRVYRSVVDPSLAGYQDTLVLYCLYKVAVDASLQDGEGSPYVLGIIPDSELIKGYVQFNRLDQAYAAINPSDSYLGGDSTPYTFDNETYSEDGELVIRPPVVGPNRIPFKDMEFASMRLWGIGDPLYKQRLYYSGHDDINDWSAAYYFSMDEGENDELVAIEKIEAGSDDILYALKHNSVYLVTGYDPEYDLTIERLTNEAGAVNRFGVIKQGNSVYFMSTEKRIYQMIGRDIKWISRPIQDWLDSVFTDAYDDEIRTFALADKIVFRQSHSKIGAAFNYISGTWAIESYDAYLDPVGSFLYDTSQNQTGFDQYSYWLYESDDSGAHFYNEHTGWVDTVYTDSTNTATHIDTFDMALQPYYIGDGVNLWQVQYVQISAVCDSGYAITATVYDVSGDSVAAGTLTVDNNGYGDYYITMASHLDKYLSVRIKGRWHEIHDVQIKARRVGRGSIR